MIIKVPFIAAVCQTFLQNGSSPSVAYIYISPVSLTCDQALFSFRSVKHSGGTGETTNVREYESDAKIRPDRRLR